VSGATSEVSMLPDKNIGVAILTNQGGTGLTYALASAIYDLLLEVDDGQDWISFYKEQFGDFRKQQYAQLDGLRVAVPDKPVSHNWDEYAGKYVHPGYGEIEVIVSKKKKQKLSVDMHGTIHPLIHMHYDVFRVEIHEIPIPLIFRTGQQGDICAVDINMEMSLPEPITFQRVPDPELT